MTGAEVSVALAGDDGDSDVAIFPDVDEGLGEFVGGGFIEDVRTIGVGDGDECDVIAGFVVDAHRWCLSLGEPGFVVGRL